MQRSTLFTLPVLATLAGLALALPAPFTTPLRADDSPLWFHVTVQEDRGDRANVRINLPLRLVERMAPLLADSDGKRSHLRFNDRDFDARDLRELWRALRDVPDSGNTPFIDVRSGRDTLRVARRGAYLELEARDRFDDEVVKARLPLSVVEALVSGREGDFEFTAALRALARHGERGENELVRIDSDDATVRVWVDRKPAAGLDSD